MKEDEIGRKMERGGGRKGKHGIGLKKTQGED